MPTTDWIHAVYVICIADAIGGAIAALDVAFPCDDSTPRNPATPELYGCQLSSNGQLPATHYGSSFVVTEEIRQRLEGLGLAQTPGVTYWRAGNPDGILHASNWPGQQVGVAWAFEDSLTAAGLKRVVTEYLR